MRQYLTIMKRMTAFIFAFLIVFNSLPVADVYASDLPDDPYVDDIPYSDPDHVDGDGHTHEDGDGHTDNEGGDGHTEEDGHVHTDDCGHLKQTDYVPDDTTLPEDALSESKAAANSASDPDLFGDLGDLVLAEF